jgi:hypothetical protein
VGIVQRRLQARIAESGLLTLVVATATASRSKYDDEAEGERLRTLLPLRTTFPFNLAPVSMPPFRGRLYAPLAAFSLSTHRPSGRSVHRSYVP